MYKDEDEAILEVEDGGPSALDLLPDPDKLYGPRGSDEEEEDESEEEYRYNQPHYFVCCPITD